MKRHLSMRVRFLIVCYIATIAFFFSSSASYAKTICVNGATGSDANTYAQVNDTVCWQNLYRAVWGSTSRTSPNASQAAQAGDTVLVAAGTYHNGNATGRARVPTLQPANSGTLGSPITFKCVTAGACVLTHTGTGSASGGPILGSQSILGYHTWDGFTINTINAQNHTGPSAGPIMSFEAPSRRGTKGITIKNFTVDSTGMTYAGGDNYPIIWSQGLSDLTIQNNTFKQHHTSSGSDENVSTLTTYDTYNVLYENNVVDNNDTGVYIKALVGQENDNVIIRYNIFKNNNRSLRLQHARNVSVYQNIIYRFRYGVEIGENIGNVAVYNNTIDEGAITDPNNILLNSADALSKTIKNNIITNTNGYAIVDRGGATFTSNYNNFYDYESFATGEYTPYTFAGWQALGYDANSITTDPRYVNATTRDYHLQAGSPARTASETGGAIGAYITGTEIIGTGITGTEIIGTGPSPPSQGRLPNPPTNLSIQ